MNNRIECKKVEANNDLKKFAEEFKEYRLRNFIQKKDDMWVACDGKTIEAFGNYDEAYAFFLSEDANK